MKFVFKNHENVFGTNYYRHIWRRPVLLLLPLFFRRKTGRRHRFNGRPTGHRPVAGHFGRQHRQGRRQVETAAIIRPEQTAEFFESTCPY